MTGVSIFKLSLFTLKFFGAYQKSRIPLSNRIFLIIWIILTFLILILCYLGFRGVEGTSALLAKKVQDTLTQFQILIRLIPLLFYKNDLTTILSERKFFWKFQDFSQKGSELLKAHKKILAIQWIFVFTCVLTAIYIIVGPILANKRPVPIFYTWVPDGPYVEPTFFFVEALLVLVCVFFVTAFDCLFSGFLIEVILQAKLLRYCLDVLETGNGEKLIGCLKHHDFLARHILKVGEVLQFTFLGQYLITITTLCMQLYILVDNLSDKDLIYLCVQICASILMQISLYCFLADAVTDEFFKIGESLYGCGWESKYSKNIWYSIRFGILRANKIVPLTAGNFFVVNREFLAFIIQTSMSFFTLLLTLKGNEQAD